MNFDFTIILLNRRRERISSRNGKLYPCRLITILTIQHINPFPSPSPFLKIYEDNINIIYSHKFEISNYNDLIIPITTTFNWLYFEIIFAIKISHYHISKFSHHLVNSSSYSIIVFSFSFFFLNFAHSIQWSLFFTSQSFYVFRCLSNIFSFFFFLAKMLIFYHKLIVNL